MVEVCNCDCLPILPLHRAQLTAMQQAHSTSLKACKEQAQVGHLLLLHPNVTNLEPAFLATSILSQSPLNRNVTNLEPMFPAASSLRRSPLCRSGNPSKLHPRWTGSNGAPSLPASSAPVATHEPNHPWTAAAAAMSGLSSRQPAPYPLNKSNR